MVRLDPSKTLYESAEGRACAMVEVFLLLACQNGASELKFATRGEELRIAELISNDLYEYPQPPDCLQAPVIAHLRRIFAMTANQSVADTELQLDSSTALAKLEFFEGRGAVVTIVRNFEPQVDLSKPLQKFWRDNSASQGPLYLAKYYVTEALWFVTNAIKKVIKPDRKSTVTC